MSWTNITKPSVGDPTKKQAFADAVIDDLTFLKSAVDSLGAKSLIKNGSFEIDADADSIPDNWTRTVYTGGTFAIETTAPIHGAKAIKFTRASGAGNGGGYIESDYFEVTENRPLALRWQHYCSAAGLKDRVEVLWFTAAKAACATASTTIYDSTANPTAWTVQAASAGPPSTARYAKLRITGGYTDTDVAGSSYWDDVEIAQIELLERIEFRTAGTLRWTAPRSGPVRVTVVGGGGGGGGTATAQGPGAGGGGGCAQSIIQVVATTVYSVVVGVGGAGGTSSNGSAGGQSYFNTAGTVQGAGGSGGTGSDGGAGGAGGAAVGQRTWTGETGQAGDGGGNVPGIGGNSRIGGGGAGNTSVTGGAGTLGGGGGGGSSATGGAGGTGAVIIEF
jgi:hypothetical protein